MLPMFPDDLIKTYPHAIKFLSAAILKDKLANCYILISKDHMDNFSIASHLAKILNCEKNKDEKISPCNICLNCKWLEKNQHPHALFVVQPEKDSKKGQIKIETIRELIASLNISSDYHRIIFFKAADLNSLPADCGNLLLKTVEETPPKTIFIFSSSTRNNILPTILSRGQIIYLNKISSSIANPINPFSIDFSSNNISAALENAKAAMNHMEENEINIQDFLLNAAISSYENLKYKNPFSFTCIYKELQHAYLKSKAFMQIKFIVQDLFLFTEQRLPETGSSF